MKTTIEWLRTLPREIRDEAIDNMRDYAPNDKNKPVESLSSAIIKSLLWVDPKWENVYLSALESENEAEMELAKTPEPPNMFDDNSRSIQCFAEISIRDWFAGMAMQGYLAGRNVNQCDSRKNIVAQQCCEYADAMLAARKELK